MELLLLCSSSFSRGHRASSIWHSTFCLPQRQAIFFKDKASLLSTIRLHVRASARSKATEHFGPFKASTSTMLSFDSTRNRRLENLRHIQRIANLFLASQWKSPELHNPRDLWLSDSPVPDTNTFVTYPHRRTPAGSVVFSRRNRRRSFRFSS